MFTLELLSFAKVFSKNKGEGYVLPNKTKGGTFSEPLVVTEPRLKSSDLYSV